MQLKSIGIVTFYSLMHHLPKLLRISITDYGDYAFSSYRQQLKSNRIITAQHFKSIGRILHNFFYLTDLARSLFNGDDIGTLASNAQRGGGFYVYPRSTRYII